MTEWRKENSTKIHRQELLENPIGVGAEMDAMAAVRETTLWVSEVWLFSSTRTSPVSLGQRTSLPPAALAFKDRWNARNCQRFLNFYKTLQIVSQLQMVQMKMHSFEIKPPLTIFHSFFKFFLNNTFYNRNCYTKNALSWLKITIKGRSEHNIIKLK